MVQLDEWLRVLCSLVNSSCGARSGWDWSGLWCDGCELKGSFLSCPQSGGMGDHFLLLLKPAEIATYVGISPQWAGIGYSFQLAITATLYAIIVYSIAAAQRSGSVAP